MPPRAQSLGPRAGGADEKHEADDPCPASIGDAVSCMRCAVDALIRLANQQRALVAQACASMAADLGEAPPSLSDPPTDEQLSEACSLAACQEACAGAVACLTCCDEVAPYELTCTLPTVTVDTPDAALQATLEENLPAVHLVFFVQGGGLTELAMLMAEKAVDVQELMIDYPSCAEYGDAVVSAFTAGARAQPDYGCP